MEATLQKRLAEKLPQSSQLNEADEDCAELKLIALAKSFGGKETDCQGGVFVAEFEGQQALDHFAAALDDADYVYSYEIRVEGGDGEVMQYGALPPDIKAIVLVYIDEDFIDYGSYEFDEDEPVEDDTSAGVELNEVKRQIKVNARGVKRIKMKCMRGYKWNPERKACEKITGQQLATNRKANRRAVLTKKSMGSTFKTRVLRKTKKAMRFRKSLGLKT